MDNEMTEEVKSIVADGKKQVVKNRQNVVSPDHQQPWCWPDSAKILQCR